jgi:type II secretory pathway component GspD/PulD (secretin)
MRVALLVWVVTLGLAYSAAPAQVGEKGKGKKLIGNDGTPAEAARKALNEKVTIDYVGQSFQEVIDHLRQKTKINFILDAGYNNFGMPGGLGPPGMMPPGVLGRPGVPGGFPGGPGAPGGQGQFHFKVTDGKLRTALHAFLEPYHLTYVILADRVLITAEQTAMQQQLRQRVSLDFRGTPLHDILRKLARETGVNVVVDEGVSTTKQLTLELDDTSLENAVRLLTEMAGLKSVPMENVLFITSAEKGTKLLNERGRGAQAYPVEYSLPPLRVRGGRWGPAAGGGFGVAVPGNGGLALPRGRAVPIPPPPPKLP